MNDKTVHKHKIGASKIACWSKSIKLLGEFCPFPLCINFQKKNQTLSFYGYYFYYG